MALTWEGKKVTARFRAAQIAGVNKTMGGAVVHAKRNHTWRNRTATLEGSIDIAEFAKAIKSGVRGLWGSRDVRYALIQEKGGIIKPVRARALFFEGRDGNLVQVQQVEIPARPYLRPAADAIYPTLARNIREAFKRSPGGRT